MACGGCRHRCATMFGSVVSAVVEYDTSKIVHIKNWKVGLMNRFIQLVIVSYIIVYAIVLQKGYQKTGPVQGAVTTKVKGAWLYNTSESGSFTQNCTDSIANEEWMVFDPADYIIPPQEPSSFFVMTNLWVTCNQTYGKCAEAPDVAEAYCTEDSECPVGTVFTGGYGPTTGRCDTQVGRCEIYGWCPTQVENKNVTSSGPKIDASNFTVLIKNSIQFPTLNPGLRKRNILPTANSSFLKTCRFDNSSEDGLYCPILSLQQIVDMIDAREDYFRNLSTEGGVVGLEIDWSCDHLESGIDDCNPKYSAKRLDNPDVSISPGYNFRFAKFYYNEGVQYRSLIKAYGILFKIQVTGQGGIFDITTLAVKLGSMIALLGIAAVVSDVIVLYVLKKRSFYREKKYLYVNDSNIDEDQYEVITEPEEPGERKLINQRTAGHPSYDSY